MAVTTYETETVALIDGTQIEVRPLKLSLLKKFMKKFETVADVAEDNEKTIEVLLECAQIAMQQYKPEIAESIEDLEELLDLPTVYKIIEVASGVDLENVANALG